MFSNFCNLLERKITRLISYFPHTHVRLFSQVQFANKLAETRNVLQIIHDRTLIHVYYFLKSKLDHNFPVT